MDRQIAEIEVTPEMIRAGLEVLGTSGRLYGDDTQSSDELLVAEIFQVMFASMAPKMIDADIR